MKRYACLQIVLPHTKCFSNLQLAPKTRSKTKTTLSLQIVLLAFRLQVKYFGESMVFSHYIIHDIYPSQLYTSWFPPLKEKLYFYNTHICLMDIMWATESTYLFFLAEMNSWSDYLSINCSDYTCFEKCYHSHAR